MNDNDEFGHSTGRDNVGENIFWSAGRGAGDEQAVAAVQSWYDEIKHYNFDTADTNGGVIGHFTQVT